MGLEADSTVHSVWKSDLYRMQLDAPVPIPIVSNKSLQQCPPFLGRDYHGAISHIEAQNLLRCQKDGAYLVRRSSSSKGQFHTLSLKFNDKVHHYKLYHDPSAGLFVREKRYDCVRALVADGLITMYLELKVPLTLQRLPTANYQESPYMTLNKRKLRALNKEYLKNGNNNNGKKEVLPNHIAVPSVLVPATLAEKQEKSHSFKVTTFKGLNWCELCGNFLWGFTAQGVKCDDCGMIAHNRCSEKFPNDCVPDLKHIRGVFGYELTTLLTAHNSTLPFVLTKCVAEVEARGLTSEGIYRVSGFADEIETLKMALDKDGEKADISEKKYPNINVVTGALKLYLRLLPIPLITFLVHPQLQEAMKHKTEEMQISGLKLALASLPRQHYDTLEFMIQHLNRISLHSAINKMTAYNLATVFALTLIGSPEVVDLLTNVTSDIKLVETLIVNCDRIFDRDNSNIEWKLSVL